jgi:ATP-binding cassette, subfamily B, bacterial CvaB/MchF/RaxB
MRDLSIKSDGFENRRSRVYDWRPSVSLQSETFDCGYVCVAAVAAMFQVDISVESIKAKCGTTSRGLKLSQLKSMLRTCGFYCEAVRFEKSSVEQIAPLTIVLNRSGHYLLIGQKRGAYLEYFDPATGWARQRSKTLAKTLTGLGVSVYGTSLAPAARSARFPQRFWTKGFAEFFHGLGLRIALLALLAAALHVAIALLIQFTVDAKVSSAELGFIGVVGLVFTCITIIAGASDEIVRYSLKLLNRRLNSRVADWLFDKLWTKPPDYFEHNGASSIYTKVVAAFGLQTALTDFALSTITAFTLGIVALIALAMLSPVLLLPVFVATGAVFLIEWRFRDASRRARETVIARATQQRSFVYDILPLMNSLRGFRVGQRIKFFNRVQSKRVSNAGLVESKINLVRDASISVAHMVDRLAFSLLASALVNDSTASLGAFVAAGIFREQLQSSLFSAATLWRQASIIGVYSRQLSDFDVMSGVKPQIDAYASICEGEIRFENVSFSYGKLDVPVLSGIQLCVKAGEFVVLNGVSGAGKSTLVKMIGGLLVPTEGRVLIDGEQASLGRLGIAFVYQTDRLIHETIRENIVFFRRDIKEQSIMNALEIVRLLDFVRALPLGMETIIGEAISGLSAGQRQRVLLARAICCEPKLLILDEATSNLDIALEDEIFASLTAQKCTLVVCSHRTSVHEMAHRVIDVADGSCIERKVHLH